MIRSSPTLRPWRRRHWRWRGKAALRAGMVLANEEGTVFEVLRHLTRRGLGGTMGKGGQRVSWIHLDDFLAAVDFIAADPLLDGFST